MGGINNRRGPSGPNWSATVSQFLRGRAYALRKMEGGRFVAQAGRDAPVAEGDDLLETMAEAMRLARRQAAEEARDRNDW